MEPTLPPPPSQPIMDLPARLGGSLADVVGQVAPGFFAVLIAMLVLSAGVVLIRRSLP
jgi:hypothetical protein